MRRHTIVGSTDVDEAGERFLAELRGWIADCLARYAAAPATDVHDQGTYTTGWEPYLRATRDERVVAFVGRLRDQIRDHFTATGQWRHGYWTMQEAHHGTEHFELFLGFLRRIDPRDPATIAQLVDAAEHLGNWVQEIPPWFDWGRCLYRSCFFGADGVGAEPGMEVNIPDHLRCANIALLAHGATGDGRYLALASSYVGRWADALRHGGPLPLALTADGPLYEWTGAAEARYRSFVGEVAADVAAPVTRAENLLASDAANTFLTLWRLTGEARFRRAAEVLLDVLVTQLADPDAAVAAAAVRDYRRATGDGRYDGAVLRATAGLDPWGWTTLALDLDARLARKPLGLGKRTDMLRWLEDGRPRRHSPALLALSAELRHDRALATRALDIGRAYLALARASLPDGRDHGCAARTVSAVARGHGRENHAGVTTAVLGPLLAAFLPGRPGPPG